MAWNVGDAEYNGDTWIMRGDFVRLQKVVLISRKVASIYGGCSRKATKFQVTFLFQGIFAR